MERSVVIPSVLVMVLGLVIALNAPTPDITNPSLYNDFHAESRWILYVLEHIAGLLFGDWYWLRATGVFGAIQQAVGALIWLGGFGYFLKSFPPSVQGTQGAPHSPEQLVCPQCGEPVPGRFCPKHGLEGMRRS